MTTDLVPSADGALNFQSELEETEKAIREITLMIEQSQGEVSKLSQRNAAIIRARHPWVLVLDADARLRFETEQRAKTVQVVERLVHDREAEDDVRRRRRIQRREAGDQGDGQRRPLLSAPVTFPRCSTPSRPRAGAPSPRPGPTGTPPAAPVAAETTSGDVFISTRCRSAAPTPTRRCSKASSPKPSTAPARIAPIFGRPD